MYKRGLFFTLLFFVLFAADMTLFGGEHEPVTSEREAVESKVEEKQQELEKQRTEKSQYETNLREEQEREQQAQRKLDEMGYTGWGWSKITGSGEYDALVQEKNEAQEAQKTAQNKIDAAQKQIEQLQKDMAQLSKDYTPETPTEELSTLQDNMNKALQEKDLSTFNENLQNVIAKTDNVADKFSQITDAIDAVVKEYPTDLTSQEEALKKIELSLNLMLGKEYESPAFKEAQTKLEQARENLQRKIDEKSVWAKELQAEKVDTYQFGVDLRTVYRQKATDADRRLLLRDAYDEVSKSLKIGSSEWIDALEEVLVMAEGIPTEKVGIDLKQELLSKAVDDVHTKLETGSKEWDDALNMLWTYDSYGGEIQDRIEEYLKKQEVKTATVNLDDLLKKGELADYMNGLDAQLKTVGGADAQFSLLSDQFVAVLGHYDTANYREQMQALSILGSAADPKNFAPAYREKAQAIFDKITGRLNVIVDRLSLGYESFEEALQGAANDWIRLQMLDEELYTAQQLRRDVKGDTKASYEDQQTVLNSLQKALSDYKGDAYDLVRNDISSRLNDIATFDPKKPEKPTKLEIELSLWEKLPDDQIVSLKEQYNDTIEQLTQALEKNDALSVKDAQERLQEIKDLIDKYKLAEREEGFAKNVDAGIEFASKVYEESKPIELTEEEKSVLNKLAAGQALSPSEATLLAGIGAKKIMSFIVTNLTPENLANADKIANIMQKAPKIANITGKGMKGVGKLMDAADTWYVKVLLAGPKLVGEYVVAPAAKRVLEAKLGEKTVKDLEVVADLAKKGGKLASASLSDFIEFTNSETFKESAEAVSTGGKILQSLTSLLDGLARNVQASAAAKSIENIPPREVVPTFDAVSSLSRRLEQLGSMEPDLASEEQVPEEKKGFFSKIKEQFTQFVNDAKSWVTTLFSGDTGIPALEKKFTAAQEAYKASPTDKNNQALVAAAQQLHDAYQEVSGSIASYKELGALWGSVMMDPEVASALEKDPTAITRDVLDQTAVAVLQSKAYSAAFADAMNEIGQFVEAASKGTAVEGQYQKLVSDFVLKDYATQLRTYQQNIEALNKSFTDYQSNLRDAVGKIKQPTTPTGEGTEGQQQTGILGGNGL